MDVTIILSVTLMTIGMGLAYSAYQKEKADGFHIFASIVALLASVGLFWSAIIIFDKLIGSALEFFSGWQLFGLFVLLMYFNKKVRGAVERWFE